MSILELCLLVCIPILTFAGLYLKNHVFSKAKRNIKSVSQIDGAIISGLVFFAGLEQWILGRKFLGNMDISHIISLDTNSQYNSQTLFDAYSFSHIIHGFIFFYFLTFINRKWSLGTKIILATMIETFWEVIENTPMIINRYRSETASLNYVGDSIINSAFDTIFCLIGFYLATKLRPKYVIALTILMELGTLLWVRDNLTLNVIMLLFPLQSIRVWQTGG